MSRPEHGRDPNVGLNGRRPTCFCGQIGQYHRRHDGYFCPASRVWLETGCADETCGFCATRPERAPVEDWGAGE